MRALTLLVALAAGCGGSSTLRLSSDDNNPQVLAEAMAMAEAPTPGRPTNALGKPLVFLVASGAPKDLIAYDLASKSELWRVQADVESKVLVGSDFIAHLEGKSELVGRDLASGRELWRRSLGNNQFLGGAADRSRVFFTVVDRSGKDRWILSGLDGKSGRHLWSIDAVGPLGIPAARGGLVFSPFFRQWVAILDARTGRQLTRIRGIDEPIHFVRSTSSEIYFGSRQGVFRLDERAASGKRDRSTYGRANLPDEFIRVHYHWDSFDPVQAGYSAYDRNRILWQGAVKGEKLGFGDDRVVVHTFRFFFGFDSESGELEWAYNHPRVDVVASEHLGQVIAFAAMNGSLGALDPATGKRLFKVDAPAKHLFGATFDAEGWSPNDPSADEGAATSTAAALASIARDRDARFNDVKRFAVTKLARLEGGNVTEDLLALILDEETPEFLHEAAVEALVARRDPGGFETLAEALGGRHDYIERSRPRAVGVVALALSRLPAGDLDGARQKLAVESLLYHLHAPETSAADLTHVIRALGTIGGSAAVSALRSFLLTHRADPAFADQVEPMTAAVDVLLARGALAERELVRFVADDPRTVTGVVEYARRALVQTLASP
jgi:outer membrane protein assembly factor BamB